MMATTADTPICPYCAEDATFSESSGHLYQGRDYGPVWECRKCEAYVGCHKGSRRALGRLADYRLRQAKVQAHAAFDPLWRRKMEKTGCTLQEARTRAYRWLAGEMGIKMEDCHIGMFNIEQCERVRTICATVRLSR